MCPGEIGDVDDLSATEREAVHEVELSIEHLHRAHGQLVAFHHNTGRAIDHLAVAEDLLRDCGHPDLADRLREEFLPRGVLDSGNSAAAAGRWSYDILEDFQDEFLSEFVAFGEDVRDSVAGGIRHPVERKRKRDWQQRSRRG